MAVQIREVDYKIPCRRCVANVLTVPGINDSSESPGELWDQLQPAIIKEQWAIRRDTQGMRYAVCPGCQAKEREAATAPLAPFAKHTACPKCQCETLSLAYCDGRSPQCTLGAVREHIHRTCGQCGYSWIEGTADAGKRPWWKFWK